MIGAATAALLAVDLSAADAAGITAASRAATTAMRSAATSATTSATAVTEAADLVAARVSAKAQGLRVEAISERTEFTTTFVNPDGTLTTDTASAPVRFKDDISGQWRDVDLTLRSVGGQVVPTASDLGVTLSAGGAAGSDFVTIEHPETVDPAAPSSPTPTSGAKGASKSSAQSTTAAPEPAGVAWSLGGRLATAKLPAPTLSGNVATYPNIASGVDLRVTVRPSAFEQDFILKTRAAADAVATGGGSWSIPLQTTGLTTRVAADGGVDFLDATGQVASRIPPAHGWDAAIDPRSGEATKVPVALSVTQVNADEATLTITPDAAWLADPARQFPITIDPTYAAKTFSPAFDTWVATNYNYSNNDMSQDPELKAGTYDGGTTKAASYLNVNISNFKGLDVISGQLNLYETHSFSCTAKPLYMHSSTAVDNDTRWSNAPAPVSLWGTVTVAKGFSSTCAAGWVAVPMTGLAQAWSKSGWTVGTVRLSGSDTDSYGWKRFSSSEGAHPPYFSLTYNRKPNAAATPDLGATVDGANSFTIPSSGVVQLFTKDSTPKFHSTATDPDGSQVAVTFEVHTTTTSPSSSTLAASCATGWGTSGSSTGLSCSPTTALAENKTYYVRAAVKDDRGLWNGTWSPWRTFYTSWTAPPAPQVSCDRGYGAGTWTDTAPAGTVTCSIKAPGVVGTYRAPGYLNVTVDGVAQKQFSITPTDNASVVHKTYTFAASATGYHEIKVAAVGRSLLTSPTTSYGFGWGAASMSTPTAGTASTGKLKVTAGAAPKGSATSVTAKVKWRVAASGNEATGWTDAAVTGTTGVTVTPSSTTTPATYSGVFDLATAVQEAGKSGQVPTRTPVRLDVQVCFTYTGSTSSVQCTWSQSGVTVVRLPHAFGAGYPTADTGVGQVALYTGEVALDATDVSVPGYSGDITLSRSHTSFAGDGTVANWPSDTVTGVFGPGWSANLEGSDAGLAGLQLLDNTGLDGSIAFIDPEGNPLVYANSGGTRTYPTSAQKYLPATADTLEAGITLTLAGTGTAARLTLTEEDGTKTTFAPLTAPAPVSSGPGTTWRPEAISEPGQAGKTTFGSDTTGRVSRIVAAVPDGMAGTSCPTSGALVKGRRAIDITYSTTAAPGVAPTSTVPGDVVGQVKSVSAWLWNPATSAMTQTVVATYAYDTSGRLVQVRDPRTGLGTNYTWDSTSTRVASVGSATPVANAFAATKLAYTSGKLTQVSQEAPVTGQADVTISRYVYGVATSGTGLPNLTTTGKWFQDKAPVTGYAVFGQDYTGAVTGTGVDWTYADLSYVDDLGYTVNTAAYGAGAWQITSTDFDTATSNVIRQLDATATAAAAAANPALDPADVDALSTQTIYNENEVKDANGVVTLAQGSRVTDTYTPARNVVLADGSEVIARTHTHTDYDQGAPAPGLNASGQQYSLPTTVTVSAATAIDSDAETVSVSKSGYAKLTSADATEGDGWALGVPTTTTTWTTATSGTGAITSTTRYDTLGRATDTRQPSSSGSDAGTTKTAYYTVAAQAAPNAACGGRPEWAGLTCRTYPADAPDQGPTLPDELTTYTMWLHPATVTETSGAAVRTTTTTYDNAERAVSTKTTATGLTGSTSRPGTYTKYRTDGLIDYTGLLNAAGTDAETTGRTTYGPAGSTPAAYDRWARVVRVTGDAGLVTTSYDAAGRLSTVTDVKGTVTYAYDGTDAAGKTERRGLTTGLTVTRPGTGGALTYKAGYDGDGNLTRQDLPGKITQITDYDEAGQQVGLTYLGQVTPVTESTDTDGNTVYTPGTPQQGQPWMAWSTSSDVTGRTRFQQTGTGAAFDTGAGVASIDAATPYTAAALGQADSYAREYRYDAAGRLTYARTAEAATDPDTATQISTCTERGYTFDTRGRRTSTATTSHPDGDCDATGTTNTVTTTGWDTADRPTTSQTGTGSYVYDLFGRQTTLPAADAPDPGKGDITLGYYDDDLPRTITQGDTATTLTLDADARRSVQTAVTTGGASPGTTTTVRRYTDSGDNPAWIETTAPGAQTPAVTRFAESIGGDLSATIASDGAATLSLADPHGDVVTTIPVAATQTTGTASVSINGWASYTEYGTSTDPTATDQVDGTLGYGWLGSKQRSTTTETAGLTLMGVRLYNSSRALFLTSDPVAGGSSTAYGYPNDPVNQFDLDGRCWSWLNWACGIAHGVRGAIIGVRAGVNQARKALSGVVSGVRSAVRSAWRALRPRPRQSIYNVFSNPGQLSSVRSVSSLYKHYYFPGIWFTSTLNKGSNKGRGWRARAMTSRGFESGYSIRYSPGTKRAGHCNGRPYWKVSSPAYGSNRVCL